MILIDTNVLSEALRPVPSPAVVAWLDTHFVEGALSSITIFELSAGVALLAEGKRRDSLQNTIARTIRRFGARIYPFDTAAAQAAAKLFESARAQGLALHQVPAKLADLQIAGIAAAYGLSLATRDIADFRGLGLDLIDPWTAP